MRELSKRERLRIIAMVQKGGDLQEGDKCPREGCRGILIKDPIILFNPENKERPIISFSGIACENILKKGKNKCDFKFITEETHNEIEIWRGEAEKEKKDD